MSRNRQRAVRDREQSRRKRQQGLQRRILGFCIFTFLLGVLCGKLVFAKEPENKEFYGEKAAENFWGKLRAEKKDEAKDAVQGLDSKEDSWKLTLVNQTHVLEKGYEPPLAEIENNYYFDARAVEALKEMLADGRKDGLDFWVCSAYRTVKRQEELYENKVSRLEAEGLGRQQARKKAATEVALPGTSEHHLGLAVDIVARSYQMLDDKQADTAEARWLKENCWKYGFILRYPTDKTEETGIIFEPWHYRYVGEEAAKVIMEQGICLEEYLEQK